MGIITLIPTVPPSHVNSYQIVSSPNGTIHQYTIQIMLNPNVRLVHFNPNFPIPGNNPPNPNNLPSDIDIVTQYDMVSPSTGNIFYDLGFSSLDVDSNQQEYNLNLFEFDDIDTINNDPSNAGIENAGIITSENYLSKSATQTSSLKKKVKRISYDSSGPKDFFKFINSNKFMVTLFALGFLILMIILFLKNCAN